MINNTLDKKADDVRKLFAIDAGYELISKSDFIKLNEKDRREYLAGIAITLYQIGSVDFFPPKVFTATTTKQLKQFTEGFINGDRAQKIVNKVTLLSFLSVIGIFFLTSISIWLKVLAIAITLFSLIKLQSKWLAKVVVEYALASPYGLLNMWNAKLLAIHIISSNKTYDMVVTNNLFEDIVLKVLAWDELMSKQLVTRDEYFQKYQP